MTELANKHQRARTELRRLIAAKKLELEALQEALLGLESPGIRGTRSLTEEQVMEIRFMDKPSIADLARRYGVDRRTIRDVIQRKTYRHV